MKQPMISVYDRKTNLYDRPFTIRHLGEAIREWDVIRKDTNTRIGKNPEDFCLRKIGEFDDDTGEITSIKPHLDIADGV